MQLQSTTYAPDGAMAAPQSPLGSRRRLGAELRRLRNRSGLTLDDVAVRMTCSTSKISRLENGKGIPKIPDVQELIRIYGVGSDTEREMLLRLVHDGREHGWWESYVGGIPQETATLDPAVRYAGLETEATAVRAFELVVVHGLLQTAAYARAVLETISAADSATGIDQLLEMRRVRQLALNREPEPLVLDLVLDESVLWRRVGTAAVMADQLEHLLTVGRLPNVVIRVLPLDVGFRHGHLGSFGVLDIPAAAGNDAVFLESFAGAAYRETQDEVASYRAVLADLIENALDPGASAELIDRWRNVHRLRQGIPT
jgi:transcriptional regulator with XRE-family HTH domain